MERFKDFLITEKLHNLLKNIVDGESWENFFKFKKDFEANGGEILGSAAFGTVISHPSWGKNKVVKIFSKEDSCYISFVRFCIENPCKFVPKFYIKPIKFVPPWGQRTDSYMYFTAMERLENGGYSLAQDIKDYIAAYNGMTDSFKSHEEQKEMEEDAIKLELKYDSFQEFIRFFKFYKRKYPSFAKKHDCDEDLHHENVMLRGSTPVITDPYASFSGTPTMKALRDYEDRDKKFARPSATLTYKPNKKHFTRSQLKPHHSIKRK